MNVAILYREHTIFFILLAKNLSMLNRKIRVKLPSHSCGLAGWLAWLSRSLTMDLTFMIHFSFYFILFCFSFIFLFLEQLGLGFISYAVTSVTNWWRSHKTDHGTWEKEVEGSGTKWLLWFTAQGFKRWTNSCIEWHKRTR